MLYTKGAVNLKKEIPNFVSRSRETVWDKKEPSMFQRNYEVQITVNKYNQKLGRLII